MTGNSSKGGAGLRLNNAANTRKSMARLLREFHENPGDVAVFRAEIYAFATLLQYFGFEREGEVENRLIKIEEQIKELGLCDTKHL